MKLLVIEDDVQMAATLKRRLSDYYLVDLAFNGPDGEYQAQINEYDLILLDLGLPGMGGLEICQSLRQNNISTPLLVVTGSTQISTKVKSLNEGVDDYLTKPFNFDELHARIRSILRRSAHHPSPVLLTVGDLRIDLVKRQVYKQERKLFLKKKEFQLLEYLMRNAGRTLTRSMILEHVWETDYESFTNTVDVHIKYLRDQIDKPFSTNLIKTVHGLGYKLDAEE